MLRVAGCESKKLKAQSLLRWSKELKDESSKFVKMFQIINSFRLLEERFALG
jgi:hypothetical protein